MALKALPNEIEAPSVDRIADPDMEYHAHVVEEIRRIEQFQKQAEQISQAITGILGVKTSWSAHLVKKYNLSDQDMIDENGIITRAARLSEPEE